MQALILFSKIMAVGTLLCLGAVMNLLLPIGTNSGPGPHIRSRVAGVFFKCLHLHSGRTIVPDMNKVLPSAHLQVVFLNALRAHLEKLSKFALVGRTNAGARLLVYIYTKVYILYTNNSNIYIY